MLQWIIMSDACFFLQRCCMGTVTGANAPIPAGSPPKGGAVLLSLLLPKFAQGEVLHASCCVCEDKVFFLFSFHNFDCTGSLCITAGPFKHSMCQTTSLADFDAALAQCTQ